MNLGDSQTERDVESVRTERHVFPFLLAVNVALPATSFVEKVDLASRVLVAPVARAALSPRLLSFSPKASSETFEDERKSKIFIE